MTCRIASRIVSSSPAPKPFIYGVPSRTFVTRLFRRSASKGTTPVPIPGWCKSELDKQTMRRWSAAAGVAAQQPRGGVCRVVWHSEPAPTLLLLSTLPTNGGRS
jgi:hypothetical protein